MPLFDCVAVRGQFLTSKIESACCTDPLEVLVETSKSSFCFKSKALGRIFESKNGAILSTFQSVYASIQKGEWLRRKIPGTLTHAPSRHLSKSLISELCTHHLVWYGQPPQLSVPCPSLFPLPTPGHFKGILAHQQKCCHRIIDC